MIAHHLLPFRALAGRLYRRPRYTNGNEQQFPFVVRYLQVPEVKKTIILFRKQEKLNNWTLYKIYALVEGLVPDMVEKLNRGRFDIQCMTHLLVAFKVYHPPAIL